MNKDINYPFLTTRVIGHHYPHYRYAVYISQSLYIQVNKNILYEKVGGI